jgi:hypothetical protein
MRRREKKEWTIDDDDDDDSSHRYKALRAHTKNEKKKGSN